MKARRFRLLAISVVVSLLVYFAARVVIGVFFPGTPWVVYVGAYGVQFWATRRFRRHFRDLEAPRRARRVRH